MRDEVVEGETSQRPIWLSRPSVLVEPQTDAVSTGRHPRDPCGI